MFFNHKPWLFAILGLCAASAVAQPSLKAQLGRQLFFDTQLSTPPGQACASCHDPDSFFRDPNQASPTSAGVISGLEGVRNTPTLLYAAFAPAFHYDKGDGLYKGGFFLDGRASTLAQQAKGPFLNPLEMANPDVFSVVEKVRQAAYAPLFMRVYGANAFADADKTFNRIADALAAFERTAMFKPFSSKYDYYLAGKVSLTEQELRGRRLFEADNKGNCAACHPSRPSAGTPPLFTDFTYDNLGVPKNPDNPFYGLSADFNPAGEAFVDKGLGGFVGSVAELGKFKVPSLRNIAKTAPYMHNGYFKTLRGVLAFYNSRDTQRVCPAIFVTEAEALSQHCWPVPEVQRNVNNDELGELNLSSSEIDDIISFLQTLTDNYPLKP